MKRTTQAHIIYQKVGGNRQAFLAAVKAELGLSDAGAATYYIICSSPTRGRGSVDTSSSSRLLLFAAVF